MLSYTFYALIGLGGLLIGFLAGFFAGNYKSRTPESAHFEKDLRALEKQTTDAQKSADGLLEQAHVRREPPDQSLLPMIVINEDSEQPSDLVVRIRKIKNAVRILKSDIDAVIHTKSKGPKDPSSSHNEASSTPNAKSFQNQVDPIVVDLFDFELSAEAANDSYGVPQIRRRPEPVSGNDLSLSRPDVQSVDMMSVRDVVELYNLAVTDNAARERFREQVEPFRIGTVNAVERRQNPTIEAEFRETTDGDLFAFSISQDNGYAVVPRLGLTIEAVGYSAGALGEVFKKTLDHDPQRYYSRYQVRRPAIFKRDGDRWELVEPGKLDLGPSD